MPGRPHRNWPQVRAYYVEGDEVGGVRVWPTISDTAARFGMPPETVGKKATRDRWTAARDNFRSAYERKREQVRLETMARESVEFDGAFVRSARAMVGLLNRQITAAGRAGDKASIKHLYAIARTMLAVQRAGKLALGEATDRNALELPAGVFSFVGGPRPVDDEGEGEGDDEGAGEL